MCRSRLLLLMALAGAALLTGLAARFAAKAAGSQVEHRDVAFDVSPDGKHVVFSSADADLYLFDLQTRRVRRLTESAALETGPVFSPDGRFVVYATSAKEGTGAGISVRSLDGTKTQALTAGRAASDGMPSYSADGRRITFVRAARHRPYSLGGWTWDDYDVYVMNRDGSGLRRVTKGHYYQASRPHFLGDGTRIVFSAVGTYPDTLSYLFSVPADGAQPATKLRPPTAPPGGSASPVDCAVWGGDSSVAPSGKQIVFISDRAEAYQYDLWVSDADGGRPHALGETGISHYNQEPVWTPDGDHLLFLAGTEENASSRPIFSLWEVDRDGSHPRRLAGSGLFTDPHRWKPDP